MNSLKFVQLKSISGILLFFTFLILFSYAVFYSVDGMTITSWCSTFLDCLFSGNIRDYANLLIQNEDLSNYKAIQVALVSIPLIPWYFLSKLTRMMGFATNVIFLGFQINVMLLCIIESFIVGKKARVICKIILEEDIPQIWDTKNIMLVFLLNTAIWMGNVAYGQIDCFENFFLLLLIIAFAEEKYILVAFFFSCCLSLKGLSIFWIVPFLALNIGRIKEYIYERKDKWLYLIKMATAFLSIVLFNWFLENVVIINYSFMKNEKAASIDHLQKLFAYDVGRTSVPIITLVVVSILCLYFGLRHRRYRKMYFLTLIPLFAFVLFAGWYPQYLTCMCIPILLFTLVLNDSAFAVLLQFMYNFGFFFSVVIRFENALDNTLIKKGPLSYRLHIPTEPYTAAEFVRRVSQSLVQYSGDVGIALLAGGLLSLIIIVRYQQLCGEDTMIKTNADNCGYKVFQDIAMFVLFLLPAGFLMFSFIALRL